MEEINGNIIKEGFKENYFWHSMLILQPTSDETQIIYGEINIKIPVNLN